MKQAIVGFILCALGASALCQQLWQGATIGMSPDAVLQAFPQAHAVEPTQSRGPALTKVKLDDVEIADLKFTAAFGFIENKLVTVDLGTARLSDGEYYKGGNAILAALRSKYGAELTRERSSVGDTYTWGQGPTTVRQINMRIGDVGWVNIYYSGSVAKDASKL